MNFPNYIKVKDNYCCLYLGNSPEYVVALNVLKPQIEEQLPGLKVFIGCNDEFLYLTENGIPTKECTKERFAHIREIRNDSTRHAILEMMDESRLMIRATQCTQKGGKICLICPEGIPPTKSLSQSFVEKLKDDVKGHGYSPVVLGSDVHYSLSIKTRPRGHEKFEYIDEAGKIIGVENEYTLLGATKGIETVLYKTGIGCELFRRLNPRITIKSL